ncbi:MAG: lipopolysaccharide biosynthesis protein [Pseudomonadota bacterium]
MRGGAVTLTAQTAKLVLNLAFLAVLARLLTPDDFGILAMATVFVGFATQLKDLGLSTATLQSRSISHSQVSTMFWLNLAFSAALALLMALLGPLIASFYDNSALIELVYVLALGIFVSGAGSQHLALLRRQMAFRSLATCEVFALAAGGVVGITMAYAGAGFWSLAAMNVTQLLATSLAAYYFCPWMPGRPSFDAGSVRMIHFGSNLALFNIVNYVTRNADDALVGRYAGEAALGAYARAYGLLMLPMRQLSAPVKAVVLPALSRLQDDAVEFRAYFLKAVEVLALLTMPVVIVMGVLADEIVLLVMGPQWGFAAELFKVFVIFAFFQAIPIAGTWTMTALGRSDRVLKWGTLQAVIAVPVFVAGLPWGAMGVAVAATSMALVMMGPALAYALHASPIRFGDVLKAVRVPVMLSASLLAALLPIDYMMGGSAYLWRIVVIGLAAGTYLAAAFALVSRLREDLIYFISFVRGRSGLAS